MNKRGLGRGLGALIPETSAFSHQEGELILSLPVSSIEPNPYQPRKDIDPEEIDALSHSIRERGLLQPVIVRRRDDHMYQLIAGERRWRAARQAGYEQIPAIVRDTHDSEMLPLALVENLLRADLNPIEEALAFRALADEASWTQEEIAEQVGRTRTHVANTLRLLRLPEEIQLDVSEGRLTAGHARAILSAETEEAMFELRDQILSQGLTVRESEERSGAVAGTETSTKRRRKKQTNVRAVSPETRELEERLQRVYGTPVQIHDRKGRGRVSLEFLLLRRPEPSDRLAVRGRARPAELTLADAEAHPSRAVQPAGTFRIQPANAPRNSPAGAARAQTVATPGNAEPMLAHPDSSLRSLESIATMTAASDAGSLRGGSP